MPMAVAIRWAGIRQHADCSDPGGMDMPVLCWSAENHVISREGEKQKTWIEILSTEENSTVFRILWSPFLVNDPLRFHFPTSIMTDRK